MSKNINKATGKPWRILWFGDLVTPSGFGRIGNEVTKRLARRGYDLQGASITYTGWPHDFPFHVWPLGGQDIWNGLVTIVQQTTPDLIISCQDFPYHQTIWQGCRIDFSRIKWAWITPIDGTPVHPEWEKLCDFADGGMVISRFGVEAMRQAGSRVSLCHPGVDTTEFHPAEPDERAELRAKIYDDKGCPDGYAPDDYVIGVVCMNQGRKAISAMIAAFHEFALDKPEAKLLLDMDKVSPAGWDIPSLLKQMGWTEFETKRVKYREDLFRGLEGKPNEAMLPLRNRFVLMDAHMVISHREGFGLPMLEGMACGLPSLALDWCSGTEIVGEGRGMLVKRLAYMEHGSWGGARDAFPDMGDLISKLNQLYSDRALAAHVAAVGREWAVRQTWDVTADQVETVIQAALARPRQARSHEPTVISPVSPGLSDTRGPAAGIVGVTTTQPGANPVNNNGTGGRAHTPAPAPEIVGDRAVLQRLPVLDAMPAVAVDDGGHGGPDGAA